MGQKACLGVIGGSGIYKIDGVDVLKEHNVTTPFGTTSDVVVEALVGDRKVFFIPRHGSSHSLTPSEVPYKANIYALKSLGVTHVLAVSAVGIMKESIKPGDFIVPDQIFDRTKGIRDSSFFGKGVVGHVSFAEPFCPEMRSLALMSAKSLGATVHDGGCYICMEGPQFSTRSESNFYRQTLKPSAIGMTAIPEAKLAAEAELSYAMIATGTDYDCWHKGEEDVSVEAVLEVLKKNASLAGKVVIEVAKNLPATSDAASLSSAKYAIMTPKDKIPEKTLKDLELLYGKYWN